VDETPVLHQGTADQRPRKNRSEMTAALNDALPFLRLRLRLFLNTFRRSPWQLAAVLLGGLYGITVAAFVVIGLFALRVAPAEVAGPIVIVLGSAITLGFLIVPLIFDVDDAMDPRKFSLFGIESKRLTIGLSLAALISVPSVVLIFIALAQVVTWTRDVLPFLLAVISVVAIVVTCVLGARVTTSVAAFLLSSRRARDATGLIGIIGIVLASPAIVLLANVDWANDGLQALTGIAAVLGMTPLGAAWAAPAVAADGDAGGGLLRTLIALAFAGLLWLAWQRLVTAMLVTRHRESDPKEYIGLGWFRWFPARPAGAIAARTLTYWCRDSRYLVSLAVVPIVPIAMFVPLLIAGVPLTWLWLLPMPVMALFLSWSLHNDVAMDHTAIWLHVATHTSGRSDRWGRAIPVLIAGLPILVGGSLVCAYLHGDWDVAPTLIGVSVCILLSGVGMSSIMSAAFPYPVVRPGDSPFQQPQSGTASALVQTFSFLAILLLAAPALLLAVLSFVEGGALNWATFWVGSAIGVTVLVFGIAGGGRVFTARAPELLAFSVRN
jgi:ABC-2 type transport system permease protein